MYLIKKPLNGSIQYFYLSYHLHKIIYLFLTNNCIINTVTPTIVTLVITLLGNRFFYQLISFSSVIKYFL